MINNSISLEYSKTSIEKWLLIVIAVLGIVGSLYIIIHNSSKEESIHYREIKVQNANNTSLVVRP